MESREMFRRSSFNVSGGSQGEPLIVVEETQGIEEEDEDDQSQSDMSPRDNPYLLSPFRDLRKRSLPSSQVTTGITASQVRRLSEQGGESGRAGPSSIEAAFLATLSQGPMPTCSGAPGGRRHSVVTISKAPKSTLLFGRNRRESFAAFSTTPTRPLQRKDSLTRSPSISGSEYNLQLDIMDDIHEIKQQARKVKLKMWQADGQQVCELQTMDGSSQRYNAADRRYSEVVVGNVSQQNRSRRASELPPIKACPDEQVEGIVCSNTDLQKLMSLSSSPSDSPQEDTSTRRQRFSTSSRSTSFDTSNVPDQAREPKANNRRHEAVVARDQGRDDEEVCTPLLSSHPEEQPGEEVH